jgi:hypothetical protein
MTGKAAPMHPRLTPKQTPSSDIDLILSFIAENGVARPTTAQEQRYARREQRDRGLLTATDPSAHRFRPGSAAFTHRSALMAEGFTLDHKSLPLEKLTGEYADKPAEKTAPAPAPEPPAPVMGYCAHCQKQLPRRSRTDALYCSDAHRKAADRKAAKIAEANKAFKTDLSIAENVHRAAILSEEYSCFASSMNWEAKRHSIEAAFMATPHGVLITEESPGAVMLATSMASFSGYGRFDRRFDVAPDRSLTEHGSRDPKVIEIIDAAVSENLKGACEPDLLGASILKRDEHRQFKEDCAARVLQFNGLLSGPERKVWILTWSRYSFGHALHRQWPGNWWPVSGIIWQ